MANIHLILGGARSGKSLYAEKLASECELPVTYIATAQVFDAEFSKRIQHHKDRRPAHWRLVEAPHYLANSIAALAKPNQYIIVDCLTLWLAQWICSDCNPPKESNWQNERSLLLEALLKAQGTILLVSNEVGMGIVPLGEINRQFQDEQGRLNQAIAKVADEVSFVAAGLPLKLKG